MFGIKKRKVLIWSVIINLLVACGSNDPVQENFTEIWGEAQGTTYSIIICDKDVRVEKSEIDSILTAFDNVLSTYQSSSLISKLNGSKNGLNEVDKSGWFERCYLLSLEVFTQSNGAFDPSIMPLVDAWGFYKERNELPTEQMIDSLKQLVSFVPARNYSVRFIQDSIYFTKSKSEFRLDFNAVAQGLAVDVLSDFLKKKGASNYYIELGGEIVVSGKNREGDQWRIGIDSPTVSDSVRLLDKVMQVSNKGIATSGNYRKFYVENGKKYAHTIDPVSGKPVTHSLLSATVVSESAGLSDAWATVFMVLGKERSIELLDAGLDRKLDVYFIYDEGEDKYGHWMSHGFKQYLK